MLSDTLSDAVAEIEEYEQQYPDAYGHLAKPLRKLKVEMLVIQLSLDMMPEMAEQYSAADYDWLREESLKRTEGEAPHDASRVFRECAVELRIKKFGK
jgi:hypothetical protein